MYFLFRVFYYLANRRTDAKFLKVVVVNFCGFGKNFFLGRNFAKCEAIVDRLMAHNYCLNILTYWSELS